MRRTGIFLVVLSLLLLALPVLAQDEPGTLAQVYGRKGADNLRKLVSKVVVSLTSSIAQYRPDLSSVPTSQ